MQTAQKRLDIVTPHYRMSVSPRQGAISVEGGSGLMQADDARAYVDHLQDAIRLCRQVAGHARILVDLGQAPVQRPDVASEFGRINAMIGAADRLALVVGSSLARLQAGRVADHASIRPFLTTEDARKWLGGEA